MASKLMSIQVRGAEHAWGFSFFGDPKHLDEWRKDGLDVCEIENVIPERIVRAGLLKPWCFLQDLWNFKNPLR